MLKCLDAKTVSQALGPLPEGSGIYRRYGAGHPALGVVWRRKLLDCLPIVWG